MRLIKSILTTTLLFTLTGCAGMLANRSFIDEMDRDTDSFWVAGEDFNVTAGDNGRAYRTREEIRNRTPQDGLTQEEIQHNALLSKELSRKINAMSDAEYTQYVGIRDKLETDSEKAYYLNLAKYEREEYLRTKFFTAYQNNSRSPASHDFGFKRPKTTTVGVGMNKNDIMKIWGRPMQVDVAGDPRYENERWSFYDGSQVKQIYFENGVVSGWILE